jgi:subtilisin family serine protease
MASISPLTTQAESRMMQPFNQPDGAGLTGTIIVKFRPGTTATMAARSLGRYGFQPAAQPELAKLGLSVIHVPAEKAAATVAVLQHDPTVVLAYAGQPVHIQETPNDPGWPLQYGAVQIQSPQAWDITTGSASITIAIVDTGVDLTHPDLQPNLITGTNVISPALAPQDDHGHGTHVAGIAAAVGNNSLGIAGTAWTAHLMPVKVLDQSGNGDDAEVAVGIVWAADHGAQVINLSLGGPCPSPVMEMAVTYAYTMGVTVVAAAGNYGNTTDPRILCPAAYEHTLAVGATDQSNSRAWFSNYGPELDVVAPGVNIYSTTRGGGYGYKSGTSMATPFVAGAAALLASQPKFDTPLKIRAALEAAALDLGSICRGPYYGAGLVQVFAALQMDPAALPEPACHYFWFPMISHN